MRKLHFAFVALFALSIAACGGGSAGQSIGIPTATPSASAGSATVSFLIVVPSATGSARKRSITVPSSATSISFTATSLNGKSYTGTATKETLASTNSDCASVNGQLSCAFNVSAPVGELVYTVTVYDGTTVIAEGNAAVTTTSGTTVNAPLTLTGTVAKIVITENAPVVEGVSETVPVTVQAEDSNGNTILGAYSSAITLTDTDASGQTSIATSGSDNPPAKELLSSSDTATISYNGGAMSSAATIGASATGVSAANVTAATFLPTSNYLAQSGSVSFGYTSYSTFNYDAVATPEASPSWTPSTASPMPVATGQTFDNVTNAIAVQGSQETDASQIYASISSQATSYYEWSASGSTATLGVLGYSDPDNSYYQYLFEPSNSYTPTLQETCAAPYAQLLVIPMPASWNVMSGAGACTTAYNDQNGETDTFVYAANGSYTDNTVESGTVWPPGTATTTVDGSGNATYSLNSVVGAGTLSVPAPSPGASTIPVVWGLDNSDPMVPTPAPTSVPNPWAAIGLANGTIPNPLLQDTMTFKGAIAALPAMCAVPSGLVPASNPPLTEADENIVSADPMNDLLPFYSTETVKHYYLNGVGEVCNEMQISADYFDGITFGFYWFAAYNQYLGASLSWYSGQDVNFDSYYEDQYTYITQTSLTAADARVRDFTKAAPAAAQALTAMTYHREHGRGLLRRTPHVRITSRFNNR